MGGLGSGRHWTSRDTTNDFTRMDVRYMEREGFLRAPVSGALHWSRRGERFASISFRSQEDRLVLSYKYREHGGEWESLEYTILLERTGCNYGGQRSWFVCPARGCGKRVATLFGGRVYACRRCYGLAYLSQRENRSDRAAARAEGILKRLACDDFMSVLDSEPPRPKGMHEKTYKRLAARYEAARYETFRYGPAGVMALYHSG